MLVQLAADRLVGSAQNGVRVPLRQPSGRSIHERRRLFDVTIGAVHAFRHAVVANREMDEAALRLRTPITIGGHLDFAHRSRAVFRSR